jgi:hypothetical protein
MCDLAGFLGGFQRIGANAGTSSQPAATPAISHSGMRPLISNRKTEIASNVYAVRAGT